jgi:hypothetical protein
MIDNERRETGRTLLALAALVGASGCAGLGGPVSEGTRTDAVVVVVQNNHWSDVTVYRVQGSERIRLGMVPSMSTREMTLGRGLHPGRQLRLEADPVGSRRVQRSGPVLVHPDSEIHWVLENQLTLSSLTVR